MKAPILPLLMIVLYPILAHAQDPIIKQKRETEKPKISAPSQDPINRYLVVKKVYSRKKFLFKEGNHVWLEHKADSGVIKPISGFLDDIKESCIIVSGLEIPLTSISRILVRRADRWLLISAAAGLGTASLLSVAGGDPSPLAIAFGFASVPLIIGGLFIKRKLPIGDKFRISTERYRL